MSVRNSFAVGSLGLFLWAQTGYAQTLPDAGVLQQQIERQLPKVEASSTPPSTVLPPEYRPASGMTVKVSAFRFAGNTLLSDEQLAAVLGSYVDQSLDFPGLKKATAAVAEAYRAAGWMVRVYLPRQDVSEGVVTLQIVEGKFGQLRFEGEASQRLSQERANSYVAAVQAVGQPLSAAAIDRALLLLDDLPGVAVVGNLAAGEAPAETDIVLKLIDEPVLSGEVLADNTGSRATGVDRQSANMLWSSPNSFGDQLSANLMHTLGSDYARLSYTVPAEFNGLRLGVNASTLGYRVVSADMASAHIKGQSNTWGLSAQYPVLRSRGRNVYFLAGFDDKSFDNQANGATTTRYGTRNFNLGLLGNLFDALGGGGANMGSLTLTYGRLDLTGSPNEAADASTTRTHGEFYKWGYTVSRQQSLTPDLSLYGVLSGQTADKNLDSSEKFYLGGANGVRAYPASEGGGTTGSMANLELRWRAQPNLVLTGFYDWGRVMVNIDNSYAGAPTINHIQLRGVGVAMAWTGPHGLTFKATYARRIGENPNPSSTGTDQDGTLTRDRFWLSASLPF